MNVINPTGVRTWLFDPLLNFFLRLAGRHIQEIIKKQFEILAQNTFRDVLKNLTRVVHSEDKRMCGKTMGKILNDFVSIDD